ncbi:MAG: TolC family protein [Phycisphaerae bacterium]|nr:TolC family protein [Phycisphaerae bacterium]
MKKFRLLLLLMPLFLWGCSSKYYKENADKEAYDILAEKWQEEFGTTANTRISDVEAGDGDIKPAEFDTSKPLPLATAVSFATANNRNYKSSRENLYLSALNLSLERYNFTPKFFGLISAGYKHNPGDESVDASSRFGVSQTLADGTEVAANISSNWLEYLTGSSRSSLGTALGATISRPLLRGAGRKIAQENLTQAERSTIYDMRDFARFRKTFVVDIVSEYYGVLQTLDQVENARRNYENLKVIEDRVVLSGEVGSQPKFEAGQARQRTLQAWDSYIRSQQSSKQSYDNFKITLAISTDQELELEPGELKALENVNMEDVDIDVEAAIKLALDTRLDLQNSFDQVEDSKRKLEIALDNLGIKLDLKASANVSSDGKTDLANFQFDDGSYALGLDTDFDLDRKSERNSYRRALISVMQRQRSYELKVDQVKQQVRQACRDLKQAADRYKIQMLSLTLAEKRVEGDKINQEEGRATTRDLLESQADLLQAQNAKTDALISFTLAQLRFYRDIGMLEVKTDGNAELDTVAKAIGDGLKMEKNKSELLKPSGFQ